MVSGDGFKRIDVETDSAREETRVLGMEIRDVRRDWGERVERVMLSMRIELEVRVSTWWRVSRSEDLPLWVLVVL